MFKKGNNFDRVKQRFSLRKLNIGVCSVLLGLTFMSGNNKTVKAETTQNPTEESKATDQSQTGPTHPQRVVVDASVGVKNNTNATNHINSGNSDNGGSDLSEVGLKGINQNNNGTETVNTAKIADQTYANAAYEASLLEVDANSSHDSTQTGESATISQTDGSGSVSSEDRSAAVPSKSNGSSDNNTETNSRSTIIGLNEYSNPKHLGKVTEPLSDTARSIKQVNITPDELKPTLLDETGKAVENTSKVLNFDLSVYVHDTVSNVNNLDLNWQIDDRLSNQIDSISIDEGKGKTPVTFKKDTDSNVWRADFNKAAQMTWVSGGVLNGHVQKTGTITFKDSIFNVLKQADILNKNNEVDTNKDPLVYRSYVSYEGDTPESGFVWGIGTQFAPDAYDPHSIIATTFNTTYFNTDKDNQIMAAEKNYGVSTADLNKDGTHSFVGGYDDVYYDSTNNTIVVDNYLNRWDSKANDNVKSWTYHYGVDPKLLPYIKSGEISRINFRHVADSGASYKSQVRALPDATDDNDPTYKYHNQLSLDPNGDGAFSGQKGTNLGNYYYGILNSRPLVIRTIYHLKDKLIDGSKMSLTGLLREIGKTTTTPQLLFTNFMTDTDGKVVKGTESVSAPTFNQLFTPIAGPDQITQTVNYVDGKNQTIASQNYVGKKDTTQDFTGQVPQGWVLDGDTLPKTITISTNGPKNIKVKIDPRLVNDLQNNLRIANALNANTDTPKVAVGALTKAIADGNNTSLYGKDAPTNMQNAINELANTNDLVQALINGKNAESTAKYYNDTNDKQKALTDAMTAGKNAISSGITAQDQFEGAASAIEKAINGLSGKETDKTALTDAISKGEAAQKSARYYNDDNADHKSALDNALRQAGEDLKNNPLTQATADQDAQAIEKAINGLKGQSTNLDKLNQAISDGTSAQAGSKYANSSADSKGALDQAIKAGQTAKTQSGLTQKEADADASAIEKAINGLSGKETDKTALTDAINKGHKTQTDSSDYQDTSDAKRRQLDKDITDAETLNQDPKASQSNVDAAAKKISDDINNLNQGTDAANNKPVIPTTKTPVGDNSHLTDDEKGQVKDNVQKSNSAGKVTKVDDNGNATITYPDGSKNVVSGKDTTTGTSKDDLNKAINNGNSAKTSGNYTNTSDQNRADLDKAIKHGQDVVNDPHASQKDIDNATKAINKAIDNVNNGQTDASKNKPVIPSTKTPVSDNSHLTDDEKGQVKDNVQESNPAGKVTNVDDHGNTTITYPDGSKNVVSGKDTTTGTSKDNLNKSIDSGNNTKSSGNYNNTSDQNRDDLDKAIKHGQDVVNDPHASQKDIDNATKAINKAIDNVNNGQTDASKNKPVIPSTKTPVSDNSHLTDDEKGQVKDNVQESNPAGKVTNVDDHGNTTITYPDGSKNTISGDQVTTVIITGDDYTYDDYAYNDFYQVIIKANAVQVYTLPKGNLTKEKKLAHDTTLTVLETKKIDGQVWYRIGTNRWIMAATTIKVGELENFKLKRLSKKTKTTATVWVNKLAIYNNVNGKMTKKHLTRGTKVRIYAIATVNGGEWYKIGKNKWIPAAGVHELNDFYQVIIKANAVQVYTLPKGNLTKEKKLAHDTTLTVLETKKIDGQVWYRIGTNRWIMAATTIKVGELENFKLKRLSKKTKTTATVWVNKLAIYNNVNGKMTKKHLTRGTKVRIYAIATVNGGEWYKIGKNKWIPAAGVHELTVEPL